MTGILSHVEAGYPLCKLLFVPKTQLENVTTPSYKRSVAQNILESFSSSCDNISSCTSERVRDLQTKASRVVLSCSVSSLCCRVVLLCVVAVLSCCRSPAVFTTRLASHVNLCESFACGLSPDPSDGFNRLKLSVM